MRDRTFVLKRPNGTESRAVLNGVRTDPLPNGEVRVTVFLLDLETRQTRRNALVAENKRQVRATIRRACGKVHTPAQNCPTEELWDHSGA